MTREQLTFAFPKRLCFYSGRPMLQLKLYFPHHSRCIRGITDQYRLPMSADCLPRLDPVPRSAPLRKKKGWQQPTLFDDL